MIVLTLLAIVIAFDACLYRSFFVNPNTIHVSYQNLADEKIPESMNDVTIVYFTDLQYGKYQNKKRTERVFKQIKELNPDILIFGGDVYDTKTNVTDDMNKELISYFNSIQAPLGKYAVYGEKDIQDAKRQSYVYALYHSTQIEVLDNKNVLIGHYSSNGIRCIGLSPSQDVDAASNKISDSMYNLLIVHQPDTLKNEKLASKPISYALAGHSHGTQITYPIFDGYKDVKGATEINRSKKESLSFTYQISSGIGCTDVNARFNATPEILYFSLKHK